MITTYPGLNDKGFILPFGNPQINNVGGTYFRAGTPTPGTGIAMGIQTSFSDTANVLALIYNGGVKQIVMDYLKLMNTVAGASTTSSQLCLKLDNKDRYTSGGTSITPDQPNGKAEPTTVTKLYFGIITANAVGTMNRIVGRIPLKIVAAPCWAINDTVVITFGNMQAQAGGLAAATAAIIPIHAGPIMIPPGHSLTVHMWNVANATTAPSWEFELGYWEIPA
jgi:hypothetical protein